MNKLVHLFSGGTDSTYAATLAAAIYDQIHLITYNRLGFYNTEKALINAEKLKKLYGVDRIKHTIINIDKEYKKIFYEHFFSNIFHYGFYNLLNCGICKLTMHYRTIIYCIDNNIKYVSDGSGVEMVCDPSQNPSVMAGMRQLYKDFGIEYFSPSFEVQPEVREKALYDMGLSSKIYVKWTSDSWQIQPTCTQEYLHLIFLQYMCRTQSYKLRLELPEFLEYEKKMLVFHTQKRDAVKNWILKYISEKQSAGH